jgi:tetratricopeptide (TPR) repeat protein
MDQVILLDAVYPRAHLKRAMWKIERGEEAAALADLDQAIESGNVPRDDVFGLFWSQGLSLRGEGRLTEAAQYFERALRYAPADRRQDVEFWWGYALFQLGEQLAKPDEASLSELQRAQQSFQAAKGHFARAGSVRREVPQLAEATDQWLENVGARIRRLSRGG